VLTTPRIVVRLLAVGALAVFGAQAWAGMVRPEAAGRMVGAALVGVCLAAVAVAATRLQRWPRRALLSLLPFAAAASILLLAGVPLHLLDLESWGDLASGLGQGIYALPGLNVPYRGVDEWNRIAMLLGGTTAAIVGVLVACWPLGGGRYGRPLAGVVVLSVLYAVPAVQLDVAEPWLEGLAFALLLGAALWAERMAPRDAPLGGVVVLAAGLVALALAPRLDAADPWVDYESIAQSLGDRGTTAFSWDHRYGPLDWPRDGREVLRIAAKNGAYWKATTLTDFDGRRWLDVHPQGIEDDPVADDPRPRWVQQLRVSVRNLRTKQFVSAGTTLRITRSPRGVMAGAPGSFVSSGRELRRGHSYLVDAYIPRPRRLEIEAAGTDYPTSLYPYLSVQLPESVGGPPPIDPATQTYSPDGPPAFVVFSGFADPRPALGYVAGRGFGKRVGTDWVRESAYARTYALARRLKALSASPYAFARAIQAHLAKGYRYSEAPPRRSLPLDAFLFEDKIGYCQQFSGAMALLLRMGGVPARVASGFSPGTLDQTRGEYVVRDLDAHSWVEAYFPGYGWIPFDPTPSVAPARAQLPALDGQEEDDAAASEGGDASGTRGSERALDPRALGQGEVADSGSGSGLKLVAAGVGGLLVVLAVAYAVLAVRWRRRYGPEEAAAELARALRRTGRAPRPGATLSSVEQTLRWSPEAAGYVRTVRSARFGFGGSAPTREQRRALRRELASGLGVRGRLRALWALPPF
ncbi:MAG TPA: transglutaminaseTgpA domain-containing protein, partial [Solirubrobacteraceae bacterium]|nr:transglutaminaseTgpA domain-containing protein [Solirubrobacteraceae bacterium]